MWRIDDAMKVMQAARAAGDSEAEARHEAELRRLVHA
jgi:hypothetical protein